MQHPDKNQAKGATSKFQALSLAHSILSDPEKRKAYDSSGSVDHAENAEDLAAWEEYWRTLFPAVTVDKIEQFSTEYKGSVEERGDILKGMLGFRFAAHLNANAGMLILCTAYEQHRGDYSKILSHVMLAEDEDAERFQGVIEAAIAAGEVSAQRPSFCDGLNSTQCDAEQQKRLQALKKAGKTAAKRRAKKQTSGDDAALIAAIQARRGGGAGAAGGILGSLAAKYGVDMADLENDPLQAPTKSATKRRRKGGRSK